MECTDEPDFDRGVADGRLTPTFLAVNGYSQSPEWLAWFDAHGSENEFSCFVDHKRIDAMKFKRRRQPRSEEVWYTMDLPVGDFDGLELEEQREVAKRHRRALYAAVAEDRGCPEPPPIPGTYPVPT